MRKVAKNKGKSSARHRHGMEKVNGSTPLSSTIHKLRQTHQTIEIPDSYEVIPAIEWEADGSPRLFRILRKRNASRVTNGSHSK